MVTVTGNFALLEVAQQTVVGIEPHSRLFIPAFH